MRTIVATTTTINGEKSFVASCFNRFDGKVAVELTCKLDEAKDFLTIDGAKKVRDRIFNPFEREYIVQRIEIVKIKNGVMVRTRSWLEESVMK